VKPDTYLNQLRNASKRDLIAACMELARLHYDLELREPVAVSRPQAAFEHVKDIARGKQEQLVGLYLDAQNKLIVRRTISMGSLNTTRSHPREILYPACPASGSGLHTGPQPPQRVPGALARGHRVHPPCGPIQSVNSIPDSIQPPKAPQHTRRAAPKDGP
jgi:hypothetical protein